MDRNLLQKAKVPMIALILFNLFVFSEIAKAQSTFGGGSGTSNDPYLIYTTDHFDQLAAEVNSGNTYDNDVYFKLMDDLDYSGKTFTPVSGAYYGEYDPETQTWSYGFREFRGNFWGNNHSINNVTINTNSDDYIGLFGCLGLGGHIERLSLGGQSSITTTGFTGGIVGVVRGNLPNYSITNVYDCHVGENVVISVHPDAAGSSYNPVGFGGVVGVSGGRIAYCTSKATISNNDIAKTKEMGGIDGRMYDGEVKYCYFTGSVIGTNKVGDIIGEKTGGNIYNNYYHATPRNGGVNGNDTDGAKWMGTVSFGEHVSGVLPSATYWDGGTPYFGVGTAMIMTLDYTEAGYVPVNVEYFANDNILLTPEGSYYIFTMPDDDVTITGNATLKRDIGYSNWVSIDIPSQTCTGDPLTPVVTVTDNMSGTPITLVENTDYTVTLPDGECIDWGDYPITITGIGNFGGQATAIFTIDLPGGGSGTEEDPYNILTTDDLDALAASVNGGDNKDGKHFRLLADLDYTGKTYTPIGIINTACHFKGIFDGHGHSIKNVVINQPDQDYQALFGVIDDFGMVKNLVLGTGSAITGKNYVGGIAGFCGGTITRCSVSEGVTITGNQNVGGIAGYLYGNLSGCVNKASVSGSTFVGGIAGSSISSSLINNLSFGAVSGNSLKGSIIGSISSAPTTLSNNYYYCAPIVHNPLGGVDGRDQAGAAMRGYSITAYAPLAISLEGNIGLFYEGKVYAGYRQSVVIGLYIPNSSNLPQCYTLNMGSLVDNGNNTYTITMPNRNITIKGNIVESYGIYYEIPCDGGTTATVIYDASYATLDHVGIEDFEYGGVQYTVTAIADGVFDGLGNLKGVNCHAPQLATIGANAFRNCTGIMYFGFYHTDTPPTLGEGVFDGLGIDTLWLMVPYCSQYDYSVHPTFGQFGEIQGNGSCEYNFTNNYGDGDKLWSNPDNWAEGEVPGETARVAIFSDCELDEDVTVGSVTINGNSYVRFTVKSGKTLTADNFIYNQGDAENFIIEDGAQVIHPNAGAKATVEKNITAYNTTGGTNNGWHLIGSPATESFAPSVDNGFLANEYDLYFYDEPTHYWRNYKPNGQYAGFDIEPLKGYLYANSANDTLGLTGTLRAATEMVNVPLSYTPTAGDLKGFNLVGNPFAHNVTTFTGSNVATEVYRMNDLKNEVTVSSISANDPLLPGEGFFVKATSDDASITFNSRATDAERSHIALELSENGKLIDRFILKQDGAPLEKFTLNENSTRIYATEDGQSWAVAPMEGNEQAIRFKAAKNGNYTLSVNVKDMDLDYLHLIDNLTGADVDLLQMPEYTFSAKTTDYASRFRLVFVCGDADDDNNTPFAYISNGNIIITADTGDATLQVIDMTGRVIFSVGGHTRCVPTAGMQTGVYVLRLIDGDSVRTQKMVID